MTTVYRDAIEVLERLPRTVRYRRQRLGLSMTAAANEAGLNLTQWNVLEVGERLSGPTLIKVLRWLDHYEGTQDDV